MELPTAKELISKFRHIILDSDGTIAKLPINWTYYRPIIEQTIEERLGIQVPNGLRLDEMEGIFIDESIKKYNLTPKESYDRISHIRKEAESKGLEEIVPNQEIIDLIVEINRLKHIRNSDTPHLTVLSNNLKSTVGETLRICNLTGFISQYLGLDNTYKPKPDTTGAKILLAEYDPDHKRTLYIGDSRPDELTAEKLGLPYVQVKMDGMY